MQTSLFSNQHVYFIGSADTTRLITEWYSNTILNLLSATMKIEWASHFRPDGTRCTPPPSTFHGWFAKMRGTLIGNEKLRSKGMAEMRSASRRRARKREQKKTDRNGKAGPGSLLSLFRHNKKRSAPTRRLTSTRPTTRPRHSTRPSHSYSKHHQSSQSGNRRLTTSRKPPPQSTSRNHKTPPARHSGSRRTATRR